MEDVLIEKCRFGAGQCATVNASGRLRVYRDLPSTDRANVFFNFALAKDSPYVGSGQLDGQGVPLNFFDDVHVRRAFNYCFDAAAYGQSALVEARSAAPDATWVMGLRTLGALSLLVACCALLYLALQLLE